MASAHLALSVVTGAGGLPLGPSSTAISFRPAFSLRRPILVHSSYCTHNVQNHVGWNVDIYCRCVTVYEFVYDIGKTLLFILTDLSDNLPDKKVLSGQGR